MNGLNAYFQSRIFPLLLSMVEGLQRDTAKPGLWTPDWIVDWTSDDHYQSIGLCTGYFMCRQSLHTWDGQQIHHLEAPKSVTIVWIRTQATVVIVVHKATRITTAHWCDSVAML